MSAGSGVLRDRTARALRRARALFGDWHPATAAAYGRAIAAWGNARRLAPIAPTPPHPDVITLGLTGEQLAEITSLAFRRASLRPGHDNRRTRRARRSRSVAPRALDVQLTLTV